MVVLIYICDFKGEYDYAVLKIYTYTIFFFFRKGLLCYISVVLYPLMSQYTFFSNFIYISYVKNDCIKYPISWKIKLLLLTIFVLGCFSKQSAWNQFKNFIGRSNHKRDFTKRIESMTSKTVRLMQSFLSFMSTAPPPPLHLTN